MTMAQLKRKLSQRQHVDGDVLLRLPGRQLQETLDMTLEPPVAPSTAGIARKTTVHRPYIITNSILSFSSEYMILWLC